MENMPVNRFIQGFHSCSHLHYSLLPTFHSPVASFLTKRVPITFKMETLRRFGGLSACSTVQGAFFGVDGTYKYDERWYKLVDIK